MDGWTQEFMKRHWLPKHRKQKYHRSCQMIKNRLITYTIFILYLTFMTIWLHGSYVFSICEATRKLTAKGQHTVQIKTTDHESSRCCLILYARRFQFEPMIIFKRKIILNHYKFVLYVVVIHCHIIDGWMN